jgi:hypothetical protein
MKPNEKIIGTLLVSLLVFGAQNRTEWLSAEELTHRPIESAILATDATLIRIPTVAGKSWFAYFRFYEPTETYFDKSWPLGDFEKIK